MPGPRRPTIAFVTIALVLHWTWETAHAVAYVNTDAPLVERFWHCLPMAIVDTAWSGAVVLAGYAASIALGLRPAMWIISATAGAVSAVIVERVAVETGRWTYNDLMPILPVVNVGLWPILQMSLLPPLAFYSATRFIKKTEPHRRPRTARPTTNRMS
ncbi:MAG TPA: hypothetical protein VI485_02915 [Vicinamibacterales bacterium]|nr:hypothetical protein [Vicinamibacterales bacterium]